LAILADFIILAAIAGAYGTLDPMSAVSGLGAGAVMLIAGFALFAAGIFGGGDAKLLAASAVWFGWPGLFRFIILVALMGGLLALAVLGLRRVASRRAWNGPKWVISLCSGDHGIPYGSAIAAASWLMIYPLIAGAGS
jgi:prepilin peptidase CpaA